MRKRLLAAAVVFAVVLLGCSTSREQPLTSSPDIPAARGTIKVSTTANRNTEFTLTVEHLAPPERVTPGATVFVVWARSTDPAVEQNLGALRVDKDLKGSLTTVTPLRSFQLFITAEPSQSSTSPTGKMLLHTNVTME